MKDNNIDIIEKLISSGELDQSLSIIDGILEKDSDNHEIIYYKAVTLSEKSLIIKSKDMAYESIKLFEKACSINSQYTRAWYGKALTYQNLGETDNAIKNYEFCLNIESDFFPALHNLAAIYSEYKQDFEKSLHYTVKALSVEPDFIPDIFQKGKCLSNMAMLEEALECFEQILEIDPTHRDALSAKGTIMFRLGKPGAMEFIDNKAGGRILYDL